MSQNPNPFGGIFSTLPSIDFDKQFLEIFKFLKDEIEATMSSIVLELIRTKLPSRFNLVVRNKYSYDSRTTIATFHSTKNGLTSSVVFGYSDSDNYVNIIKPDDLIGYLKNLFSDDQIIRYFQLANTLHEGETEFCAILRAGEQFQNSANDIEFRIAAEDVAMHLASKKHIEYEIPLISSRDGRVKNYFYEVNGASERCVLIPASSTSNLKFKTLVGVSDSII